ncbi:TetR/AcrR family transcriptional regulator [Conexibacter woesei]|uniref:Transcriptional regulator, TetR family n=1 Tax=Conexibacter woesei (strain DSM 14684 / CCUG 47730 / CIP 108061 / JCM 11494 / NBRC 100937 / ID131577) TaxID=469383 RepID=D3F4B1_CONWI|nr:TetR family transcriptional regulator [Conexibacter woesei]ADB50483.1 transcriptional regulator, TetR family [Conexibacter woesei DSM 14684]
MSARTPTHLADGAAGDTRERLLAAALDLFFRQGFRATSVREITIACGRTPGALYNHFDSKEEVLYTLIDRVTTAGTAFLERALAQAPADPAGQFFAGARSSTLFYARHRAESIVAAFEYVHLPDERRRLVIARRRQLRLRLERVLDEGIRQGVFRLPAHDGTDAAKLATTAVANLALRPTELSVPDSLLDAEQLADVHGALALQMVGVIRHR